MEFPSQEQCIALWDKYKMPENIRTHTRAVARVADKVAAVIAAQGVAIDLDLVNRGALLHDIAKLKGIQGGSEVRHTVEGGKIIEQEGLGRRLAEVVRNHGLEEFSFDLPIEDQIVNYADRRVVHDTIVSLEERLADLKARYLGAREIIEQKRPLYEEFERRH
jgi:putative nucleotidyltransferase with HDIG domain